MEKFSFSELTIEKIELFTQSFTKFYCISVFKVVGCLASCLTLRPCLMLDPEQFVCIRKEKRLVSLPRVHCQVFRLSNLLITRFYITDKHLKGFCGNIGVYSRLIVSGYKYEQVLGNTEKHLIWESNNVKFLGITVDRDLKFDKHVLKLCGKAYQKLSSLSRMANLLSLNKRRALFKAFVESQFKCCPIVWMFHSRSTNKKTSRLHERALRTVYDDDVSTFHQLLTMGKSFCIHHPNIQRLLIEIYKALHGISGNSLKKLFVKRESTISLWSKPELV